MNNSIAVYFKIKTRNNLGCNSRQNPRIEKARDKPRAINEFARVSVTLSFQHDHYQDVMAETDGEPDRRAERMDTLSLFAVHMTGTTLYQTTSEPGCGA